METIRDQKLRIKYNRVSTLQQSGDRFALDKEKYDIVLFDKVSGPVPLKERPKAKELLELVRKKEVFEIAVEDFSRLGRNTGDVISTLEWFDEYEINIVIRNLGLQNRQNSQKNPIWRMISSVMSSIYELERENILERTSMGRQAYVQKGGLLGRPKGSNESEKQFLNKAQTQSIVNLLNKKRTVREISAITKCSRKTILKAKRIGTKYGLIKD